MFAVTGKVWSVDKVSFEDKNYLRLVIHKKHKDKKIALCFLIFKESIIADYQKKVFSNADSIEVKFYIKANEYKDRYYNNLFVNKITLLRKAKDSSTLNMFSSFNEDPKEF